MSNLLLASVAYFVMWVDCKGVERGTFVPIEVKAVGPSVTITLDAKQKPSWACGYSVYRDMRGIIWHGPKLPIPPELRRFNDREEGAKAPLRDR